MSAIDWIRARIFPRTRSFFYGLLLPMDSAKLILSSRKLMFWSILPILLTLGVYVFLIAKLQSWAELQITGTLSAWGWATDAWSTWITLFFAKIGIFILAALSFSIAASIVASPFNDLLAERAEPFATPALPVPPQLPWTGKLRLIVIDLGKSIAAGVAGFLALLLSWVPIVNLVAFAVSFLLISFQFTSYPQTRRNIGLREGLRFLWRHGYACAGFGLSLTFLFAIPFVSALALPVAVVGGTLLVARAPGSKELQPLR